MGGGAACLKNRMFTTTLHRRGDGDVGNRTRITALKSLFVVFAVSKPRAQGRISLHVPCRPCGEPIPFLSRRDFFR